MQDDYPLPPLASRDLPPPASGRYPRLWMMVALLIGLVFLLTLPYLAEQIVYAISRGTARAEADVNREYLSQLPAPENRYRSVAKVITPSVVAVEMVRIIPGRRYRDEWTSWFVPPSGEYGQGSGVIVDEAGYIVTNAHVVSRASEVHVTLFNGEVIRSVQIVGTDPASDLAVLKIEPGLRKLVAATWGDSDTLEVGDPVLAIGSPFGLSQTVTSGIVSTKNRYVQDRGQELPLEFLQTDAAVNPGNSGGPLVNVKGEIVGINTMIYGSWYQGIAFAIPSRLAQQVYERLKAGQPVLRGWLGVGPTDVTQAIAQKQGLEQAKGALVAQVVSPSPAEQAGIQEGDVIVKWGSKPVNTPNDLRFLVASTQPGSEVKVDLYREGRKVEVTVTVGQRQSEFRP